MDMPSRWLVRVIVVVLLGACDTGGRRDARPASVSGPASTVAAGAISAVGAPMPVTGADGGEPPEFRLLDAVGPLESDVYSPAPVVAAINALQPLGRARATALLSAYVGARTAHHLLNRGALFAVVRVLYEPPAAKPPFPPNACTPRQTELLSGGCLRPPRLGAPVPSPPEDLRSLRYPFFVLGDVPLSLVSGYVLGGDPESLTAHIKEISAAATGWLAHPLKPKTADEIRYLLMHYGEWGATDAVTRGIEQQLARLGEIRPP